MLNMHKVRIGIIICKGLMTSGTKNSDNCPEEEDKIGFQRPVIDILHIELHPFFEDNVIPVGYDLPGAGDSGLYREPAQLPALIFFNFLGQRWPWAYK